MSIRPAKSATLKVLHVGKYFSPHSGGMETYLRDIMSVQSRQGLAVMAVVHSSERRLFDSVELHDAMDSAAYWIMRSARWFNLGFVPISPAFLWTLSKAVSEFEPDIIHVHHPNSTAIWLLARQKTRKITWVSTWHADIISPSSNWLTRLAYRLYKPFEQRLLSRSRLILASSPEYLADSEPLREHKDRCKVMPLGLDLLRLPKASEVAAMQQFQAHPTVLFLGRICKYKGLNNLLEAMAYMPDIACWIAGDGPYRRTLEKQSLRLKLCDRVHFLGKISEACKWRYLKSADVLALPSIDKNEAFGVVMLEAGYMGTPVITTNIPGSGTAWVASHFAGSKIVDVQSVPDLVRGLREVLDQKPTLSRQSMGPETPFSLEDQVAELENGYKAALHHYT